MSDCRCGMHWCDICNGDVVVKQKANMSEKLTVELIEGAEGMSLYINSHRVAGNKPWGGGHTIKEWKVSRAELMRAING